MSQDILELAKKLKALADRGVDGEKDNAAAMLKKLMDKNHISVEDIEKNEKHYRGFKWDAAWKDLSRKFITQVIASVIGGKFTFKTYKGKMWVEVTDAEFIEISQKVKFYWKKLIDDFDIFYKAFIQKNKLYSKKLEDEEDEKETELTFQEAEELRRMFNIMKVLKPHAMQITESKKLLE